MIRRQGKARSTRATDKYQWACFRMVERQLVSRGIIDPRVIGAMSRTPRELFIEEALRDRAYDDCPLPIGDKQTISQPFIVALMTQALALEGREQVLEIGTGSGYQTAILAQLAAHVYSIERLPALARRARSTLDELGITNVAIAVRDGSAGWKEEAPFDAVLVTAASPKVPPPLVRQLKTGGRIVIPVGSHSDQMLVRGTRRGDGSVAEDDLGGCRFVDLIGEHGWQE